MISESFPWVDGRVGRVCPVSQVRRNSLCGDSVEANICGTPGMEVLTDEHLWACDAVEEPVPVCGLVYLQETLPDPDIVLDRFGSPYDVVLGLRCCFGCQVESYSRLK